MTFNVLSGFVVLLHDRRQVVHFNVTAHPTALWTAQQIIEAFPEETAPRFLLRDCDQIYGGYFRCRVVGMGIEEVVTAAQSPSQNPYAERLIGSIWRECLDHLIVLNDEQLRRILREYFYYYNEVRPPSPPVASLDVCSHTTRGDGRSRASSKMARRDPHSTGVDGDVIKRNQPRRVDPTVRAPHQRSLKGGKE